MASIRKQGSAYEIRECRATERGPRQFVLARFSGVLTPEVLDEASGRARTRFDRAGLVAYARARGIPVSPRPRHAAARRLLAELRSGSRLEPSLVALLREALELQPWTPLPAHLEDAAEWVGRSDASRGKALRGLLRVASRALRSGASPPADPGEPFPRIDSGGGFLPVSQAGS